MARSTGAVKQQYDRLRNSRLPQHLHVPPQPGGLYLATVLPVGPVRRQRCQQLTHGSRRHTAHSGLQLHGIGMGQWQIDGIERVRQTGRRAVNPFSNAKTES